jgi:hypothetical protein
LELSSTLAKEKLNWRNCWSQENAVISTVNWWKSIQENTLSPIEACDANLEELFAGIRNE